MATNEDQRGREQTEEERLEREEERVADERELQPEVGAQTLEHLGAALERLTRLPEQEIAGQEERRGRIRRIERARAAKQTHCLGVFMRPPRDHAAAARQARLDRHGRLVA